LQVQRDVLEGHALGEFQEVILKRLAVAVSRLGKRNARSDYARCEAN